MRISCYAQFSLSVRPLRFFTVCASWLGERPAAVVPDKTCSKKLILLTIMTSRGQLVQQTGTPVDAHPWNLRSRIPYRDPLRCRISDCTVRGVAARVPVDRVGAVGLRAPRPIGHDAAWQTA